MSADGPGAGPDSEVDQLRSDARAAAFYIVSLQREIEQLRREIVTLHAQLGATAGALAPPMVPAPRPRGVVRRVISATPLLGPLARWVRRRMSNPC